MLMPIHADPLKQSVIEKVSAVRGVCYERLHSSKPHMNSECCQCPHVFTMKSLYDDQ